MFGPAAAQTGIFSIRWEGYFANSRALSCQTWSFDIFMGCRIAQYLII